MNRTPSICRPSVLALLSFALTLSWTSLSHAQRMVPVPGYDRLGALPQANRNSIGPAGNPGQGLPTEDSFGGGNSQRWTNGGGFRDPALDAIDTAASGIDAFTAWANGLGNGRTNSGSQPRPPQPVPPRQPNGRGQDNRTIPADEFEFQPQNSGLLGGLNSNGFGTVPDTFRPRRLGIYGHIRSQGGFAIESINQGSLALRLGFEPGDEIVAVNGNRVWSANQIIDAVNSPSRMATFVIRNVRDGQLIRVTVRI